MRTGNLTAEEALGIEKTADDRRQHRGSGLHLLKERDQGGVVLSNGKKMYWNAPRPEFPDKGIWVYPKYIPDNWVELDGVLYDAEELRRWLRYA